MSPNLTSTRFSIIIPTCGRVSLQHTLNSVRAQELCPGDEVILATDGVQPLAWELFRRSGLPGRCVTTDATRDYGGTQRNRGMRLARGDYLLFMDDDDVYTDGALAAVREAVRVAPGRPHIFRMRYNDGRLLWTMPRLEHGNISTQMFVVPRHPSLVPWDPEHGHDFRFVKANLPLWPDASLIWREEIIALIRPYEGNVLPLSCGTNQHGRRSPEECAFRSCLSDIEADPIWNCGLPAAIIEDESRLYPVRPEACEACCSSWPSSISVLNPVTASHLYCVTEQIIQDGGTSKFPVERAELLQLWAEKSLATDEV